MNEFDYLNKKTKIYYLTPLPVSHCACIQTYLKIFFFFYTRYTITILLLEIHRYIGIPIEQCVYDVFVGYIIYWTSKRTSNIYFASLKSPNRRFYYTKNRCPRCLGIMFIFSTDFDTVDSKRQTISIGLKAIYAYTVPSVMLL